MKKKYFLSAVLCGVLATAANAQITINRSHLFTAGQKTIQATDTNTLTVAIATNGANKTWNYSGIANISTDTFTFGNADWYPGYQNFPDANMGLIESSNDSSVTFLKVDNSELSIRGQYSTASGGGAQHIKQKLLALPASYNGTFKDTTSITTDGQYMGIDPDGPGPAPTIDSIRVKLNSYNTAKYDGWGSLTTPLGNFPTLMETVERLSTTDVDMYANGSWQPMPKAMKDLFGIPSDADTSYQVFWWTNDANVGFPLLQYSYGPNDSFAQEVVWLVVKPQSSGTYRLVNKTMLLYPNPASSMLQVSAETATSVRISDLQGKVVLSAAGNRNFILDIAALKAGIYSVSVYSKDALLGRDKLIKK